jgi:hypothetical protein
MLRRLALAAIAVILAPLAPSPLGYARAAATLCPTTAIMPTATATPTTTPTTAAATSVSAPPVVVLPLRSNRLPPVSGVFCFRLASTPGAGYALPYEARVTGLDPAMPAMLRVAAILFPISRYTARLDVVAYVYQPASLLQAQAKCGCIQPALKPGPHPNTRYRGIQVIRVVPDAQGDTAISRTLGLPPASAGTR